MSRRLEDLAPAMLPLAEAFLEAVAEADLGVILTQTRRLPEEQAALYAQGRTKPGKVVTNAKPGESAHNHGLAFDIAFLAVDGTVTWDGPWSKVGAIGESVGLAWGGRWKSFPDRPHFEMPDWRKHVGNQHDPRPTLRLGDSGPAVARLQTALNRLLWWLPALKVDGILGNATDSYVWEFSRHIEDMPEHSAVTPTVWASINAAIKRTEGKG